MSDTPSSPIPETCSDDMVVSPLAPTQPACAYQVVIEKCTEKSRTIVIDFTVTSEFGGSLKVSHMLKGSSGWKKMSITDRVSACWEGVRPQVYSWLTQQAQLPGMSFNPETCILMRE